MAKKRSWFSLMKRLFIWDTTHSTQEKKEKRRKWIFGRLKTKRMPSIRAPPPQQPSKQTTRRLSEAEEEQQNKHALTVAIASAAAAEAAITAAQVAVEAVRLQSAAHHQHKEKQGEFQHVKTSHVNIAPPHSTCQYQRERTESAAIRTQTAFRGYLARKALRALKGIVKLQAIIRGRAVRRQAMSTLKCLQSIVSIQSQVCARRLQISEGRWDNCDENEEMQGSRDKIIRMDSNSARKWDDSILLKEELDACCISKKEAAFKRERIKEYSFNHRRSAETERNKVNGRWRYWMEQWVDTQLSKSKELEDLDSILSSHSKGGGEIFGTTKRLKLKNIHRQTHVEGLYSPSLAPRNSFPQRKQSSEGEREEEEDQSIPSSLAIPKYMAATKSAQAKVRSTSSPRVRAAGNLGTSSESNSPCKKRLSVVTYNVNSGVLSSGRMGKLSGNQQRSPSIKGLSRPVK